MPEHSEHTSAADVLESSELAARLIRRLTSSPGVIDTRSILKTYARLTEWFTHAHPLLNDLLTRYNIEDGSALRSLPLVADQPGMLNINTYLTNNNSFSSTTNNSFAATTNQFISPANTSSSTTPRFPPAALSSSSSSSASVHSSSRASAPDAKMVFPGETSQSQPAGKFRVSRSPARRSRQRDPVDAGDATHDEGGSSRFASGEEGSGAQAKEIGSSVSTGTNLPLARTPPAIQRELPDASMKTARPFSKVDDEMRDERRSARDDTVGPRQETRRTVLATTDSPAATLPSLPLVQKQAAPEQLGEALIEDASERQHLTAKASASDAITLSALPLVQPQISPSQLQTRPLQFVWRKSEDALTMRDLLSDLSSSSPLAAVRQALDSLPTAQSRPSNQSVKPESSSREVKRRAGEEITTEGMLRRISTVLLIERERRGY